MAVTATGWHWEDFSIGQVVDSEARAVSKEDVDAFTRLSEDDNPLHTDAAFAQAGPFGKLIAHGMLVLSVATGLTARTGVFRGTTVAFAGLSARFISPVYFGDRIRCRMKVKDKRESNKPDRGIVVFDLRLRNQNGDLVAQTEWTLLMKRKGTG